MIALLPIVAQFAPWLARQLFGDTAGTLTKQVADAAQSVFGTANPDEIAHAIAADAAKALEFKRLLLDLQDKESQRLHEERMAEFESQKGARSIYGGASKGIVDTMTLITVIMFFVVNGVVLWGCYKLFTMPAGTLKVNEFSLAVAGMVGSITTYINSKADIVWGFFFGSSSGSSAKTDAMSASLNKALQTAVGKR